MKKYILAYLLVAIVFNLTAQVLTQKTNTKNIEENIKLKDKANTDIVTTPTFDINKLIEEDEINKNLDLPYRFGYAFEVEYNMQNSGTWEEVENGKVWSLKIVSDGAFSINLAYNKFYLPENSQLYIYNEQKTVLQGPFTSKNNTKSGEFSSDLVEGSAIILEYFEPDDVKEKPEISISKIVHAYRDLFPNLTKGFGSSGSCNVDINCVEGNNWQDESNAVAMILVGSDRICSGCMVNNTNQDFTPYFLTANHCISGQNVNNWSFRFQYKSPSCNGGDDYSYYSYHGADLEANSSVSDFALLELDNRPNANTGITYAGWSRSTTAPNSVVGIHHPAGDVMKIAIDSDQPSSEWNNTHWFVDNWDLGTTEGGSSGSPLFDPNNRIIGQDHAGDGNAPCHAEKGTYYGRFDVSWTHGLSAFLDPNNTGATTTNTVEIPYVSGTSTVCSSNSTFTLHNRPPGSAVTWTRSSNLLYVSGQGTNNYTVRARGSGNGWVQANINGSTYRKNFWVGKPTTPVIHFPFSTVGMNSYIETFATSSGASNYTWSIGGGTLLWGQGTDNIALRTSSHCLNDLTVRVTSSNTCGNSTQAMKSIPYDCSGGPNPKTINPFKISPNPAKDILYIEFDYTNVETSDNTEIIEVYLYNKMMSLVKFKKFTGNSTRLNLNNLKPDIYILKIKLGNDIYDEKIIVTD